ncbi:flagellar basal body rod protein FlgB [Mesorhizobium microcysteis]|jgi:flagellar basal-body rod protein FlgB|uniref:Flagellar basal body rod protein FlgB n=1 Tax=Neoaquamicrobium microcysteis TaxID=2682781 RepID=A0A5D4GPX6_9HYPH|nr:flagellar basal body rod protein FlgB [Mesorhizobium microcysteis]TYR30112.1 flagellar basal body rod protein FlgB [Mesorhizobium microcysteis]
MQPVNLFDLASQQARWLAVRHTAVSSNIANANTPGYGTLEVQPFEAVLKQTDVSMRATHPRHISFGGGPEAASVRQVNEDKPAMPSGNSVVLENELMKSGEVRRTFELNTAIVKSFHRMLLMTTRG